MSALQQLDANTWVDVDQVEAITARRHHATKGGAELVFWMRTGAQHVVVVVEHGEDRTQEQITADIGSWLYRNLGPEHIDLTPPETDLGALFGGDLEQEQP